MIRSLTAAARGVGFFRVRENNSGRQAAGKSGLVVVAFLLLASPALSCPMCKDATVDTEKATIAQSAGLNFNNSIYVMLGGFAGLVGMTGRLAYKAAKSCD